MINVERSQVRKETAWAIMYTQPGALTGHVMLLLMFFIYTTAHVKIRTQCFEAFWYTHHLVSRAVLARDLHADLTQTCRPSSSSSGSTRTPVSRLGVRCRRLLISLPAPQPVASFAVLYLIPPSSAWATSRGTGPSGAASPTLSSESFARFVFGALSFVGLLADLRRGFRSVLVALPPWSAS